MNRRKNCLEDVCADPTFEGWFEIDSKGLQSANAPSSDAILSRLRLVQQI